MIEILFAPETFAALVRSLVPLLLLGLGGLLCHRVGVFNVSLEGVLLAGAFGALAGTALTGSPLLGVAGGVAAGLLASCLVAFGGVARRADPIVVGIAVNLLVAGVTSFLLFAVFGVRGSLQDPSFRGLDRIVIPGVADVPYLGPMLGTLTILGYAAIVATALMQLYLSRTVSGLRLRGVGMGPGAAATLGVRPARYQTAAVLVAGVLGGLAGAQLSIGTVVLFTENMSAGRGWIVVVAVLVAGGRVLPLLGILIVFSYVYAVGIRLQGFGFPVQFSDAAPYLVTLVAMIVIALVTRARTGRVARFDLDPS